MRLDLFCATLSKIDIEGTEETLFMGDSAWIEKVKLIAIEFHGDSRLRSGFDDIMKRLGFTVDDSYPYTVVAWR